MPHSDLINIVQATTKRLLFASWENPFGPEHDVCMVGGRMFALLDDQRNRVTLKCDPDEALALCASHTEIIPGYHMNKKHWITVSEGIDLGLLEDLIIDSYFLVGQKIPKKNRPALGISD